MWKCWLFGHKYMTKAGGWLHDTTTWRYWEFCQRCGKAHD